MNLTYAVAMGDLTPETSERSTRAAAQVSKLCAASATIAAVTAWAGVGLAGALVGAGAIYGAQAATGGEVPWP